MRKNLGIQVSIHIFTYHSDFLNLHFLEVEFLEMKSLYFKSSWCIYYKSNPQNNYTNLYSGDQ